MRGVLYWTLLAAAIATAHGHDEGREITDNERRLYNYVIVVGVVALLAVLVPLHSIFRSQTARTFYRAMAITSALLGSSACFLGASMGGTLWQALPTGVFLIFLGGLVALRVVGGFDMVQKGVRGGDTSRINAACLDRGMWRSDMGKEEWEKTAEGMGLGRGLLLLGGENDQDVVAVGLLRKKLWQVGGDMNQAGDAPSIKIGDRNEPMGVTILGLVPYEERWLAPVLQLLASDSPRRQRIASAHHVAMVIWLIGMLAGALAKTGWWPAQVLANTNKVVGNGNLRTIGIWLQTLLLLIAVFALPITRGCVRFGARASWRLALVYMQAAASLAIGIAMLARAREPKFDGNNVAYALALAVAAAAAGIWSLLSVWAYGAGVQRLLRGRADGGELGSDERKLRAYLAALITRPRYGYVEKRAAARWGDVGNDGRAGLEVQLELESDKTEANTGREASDAVAEVDEEAASEWAALEGRMKKNIFRR